MSNEIVTVTSTTGTHYAILHGGEGRILLWEELRVLIDKDKYETLSEDTVQQLWCDGTAFFDSKEEAEKVMSVLGE